MGKVKHTVKKKKHVKRPYKTLKRKRGGDPHIIVHVTCKFFVFLVDRNGNEIPVPYENISNVRDYYNRIANSPDSKNIWIIFIPGSNNESNKSRNRYIKLGDIASNIAFRYDIHGIRTAIFELTFDINMTELHNSNYFPDLDPRVEAERILLIENYQTIIQSTVIQLIDGYGTFYNNKGNITHEFEPIRIRGEDYNTKGVFVNETHPIYPDVVGLIMETSSLFQNTGPSTAESP